MSGGRGVLHRTGGSPGSIVRLLRMLPRVSRPRTALLVATTVAVAALPVVMTAAIGLLVGAVPRAVEAGPGSPQAADAYRLLAVGAVALLLARVVGHVHRANARNLGREVELVLQERVVAAVARPEGIVHLEDDETLRILRVVRQLGADVIRPERAVDGLAAVVPQLLSASLAAVVLAFFEPWIGLAWFVAWPVLFLVMQREYARMGRTTYERSAAMREPEYLRDLAISPGPAKEIRVWRMMPWLLARYDALWNDLLLRVRGAEQVRVRTAVAVVGTLLTLSVATVLRLVDAGLSGAVGLGALGVYLFALRIMFDSAAFDDEAAHISFGATLVTTIDELDARLTSTRREVRARLPEGAPERDLQLRSVAFTYPGRTVPVFDGLDLTVEAGTSLAVVGHNGAGKTTLVKLLAGLYAPDRGTITVDGVDLAQVAPEQWRRRLSALFQDFTRYRLTVRENITLGAPWAADDTDAVWAACEPIGIRELVESLPRGLDTVLSGEYEGGTDLSDGQWQRIALARALFAVHAGARVLVLDEPAAALDARTEAEFYRQFLDITAGLTTIVISHRFSTVRRADRIVVLDGGRVVEDGSHESLMALGGTYATAFALQAARMTGAGRR
ncbi:ATP-binding cassette domain-containing protein [Cellulomonas sp. JZ18]|uniref:ABC transporter ATP-binding protein n=1 Tax=Cellulomonas sp. JZ18 TaxID=2654191 RepID=UPI0012D432CA|nr:ATP-binding cassette domain-containing protein [Cellulomonas sp. JZ18]QGQ18362.1 ATP-binding cassette domain-containing protein [Cellulomonas sp. JZ18]